MTKKNNNNSNLMPSEESYSGKIIPFVSKVEKQNGHEKTDDAKNDNYHPSLGKQPITFDVQNGKSKEVRI